jgi:hypothetical protein
MQCPQLSVFSVRVVHRVSTGAEGEIRFLAKRSSGIDPQQRSSWPEQQARRAGISFSMWRDGNFVKGRAKI